LVLQSEKGSKVWINAMESSKSNVGGGGGVIGTSTNNMAIGTTVQNQRKTNCIA